MKTRREQALGGLAIKNRANLPPELIYADAFWKLTLNELRVLIRFYQKRRFTGKGSKFHYTDEPIVFTYSEADALGITRASFKRAITKLYDLGFIDIVHQGGSIGNGKDWSRYRIIDEYKLYGTNLWKPRKKRKCVQVNDGLIKYNRARSKHNQRGEVQIIHGHG